ncbi:OpgC domain-containing protein [Bradyrhizobium icense]|uniref:OpgC domain-containing protein n=1 Tax=Bradyrhizobium icense TaxID=1274631 RepID=UPI0009F4E95F
MSNEQLYSGRHERHRILFTNYRDVRLDLFRGAALWALFLDHAPQNVTQWVTIQNYGSSGAADLFVVISGHTTCFASWYWD